MEYEKYTEQYEFGGLNDNKKITAVFDHYEVENVRGEMYIGARLTEGESPKLQEGYGINGQQLWVHFKIYTWIFMIKMIMKQPKL